MKFSGKMYFKIILKVASLKDTFFEEPQGGGGWFDPPGILGLKRSDKYIALSNFTI